MTKKPKAPWIWNHLPVPPRVVKRRLEAKRLTLLAELEGMPPGPDRTELATYLYELEVLLEAIAED